MAIKKTESQIDRYNRFGKPMQWVAAAAVGTVSASSTFINLVRSKFHDDNRFRQGFSVLNESKNLQLQSLNNDQIEKSLEILGKYVGDHPAYKAFVEARIELTQEGKSALYRLARTDLSTQERFDLEHAVDNYARANETLEKECRDGIDRALRSPEYKTLAIESSVKQSKLKIGFDRLSDSFAETMYGIKSKGIIGHTKGVWERFVGFGGYTKRNMMFKTAVAFGVAAGGTMMVFNQLHSRDKLNELDKQSEVTDRKLDALLESKGIEFSSTDVNGVPIPPRRRNNEIYNTSKPKVSGSHAQAVMQERADAAELDGLDAARG